MSALEINECPPTNHLDTNQGTTTEQYLAVAQSLGFVPIIKLNTVEFKDLTGVQNILFHPQGVLLIIDSFGSEILNAKMCYNWRPNQGDESLKYSKFTSGTCATSDHSVRVSYTDVREALKDSFFRLQEHGQFLNPWVEQAGLLRELASYIYISSNFSELYRDKSTGHVNYQKLQDKIDRSVAETLNLLPESVKSCINPPPPSSNELCQRLGLSIDPVEISLADSEIHRRTVACRLRLNPAQHGWDEIERTARTKARQDLQLADGTSLKDIIVARRLVFEWAISTMLDKGFNFLSADPNNEIQSVVKIVHQRLLKKNIYPYEEWTKRQAECEAVVRELVIPENDPEFLPPGMALKAVTLIQAALAIRGASFSRWDPLAPGYVGALKNQLITARSIYLQTYMSNNELAISTIERSKRENETDGLRYIPGIDRDQKLVSQLKSALYSGQTSQAFRLIENISDYPGRHAFFTSIIGHMLLEQNRETFSHIQKCDNIIACMP